MSKLIMYLDIFGNYDLKLAVLLTIIGGVS
jgi:hypothetical protein